METKQMYSDLIDFDLWLIRRLEERNMKISTLAKLSGVHPNTIRNYVHNKCAPTLYNVLCIAQVLGYTVEAIKYDNK